MSAGHVFIVGAGPGDPGLITLAGLRALEKADVVVYDALIAPSLLRHAPEQAELVHAGKRSREHAMQQSDIEALLVEHALAGKQVVRLKGGDPFVFGRGGEEALACRRAGVAFTVVPGISSALAAPAYAGIPATHRGMAESVLIITASGRDGRQPDWKAATAADSIVVLMGRERLADVCSSLMQAGKPPDTPAATIRWGTRHDQQVVTGPLNRLPALVDEACLAPPVVTVVGPAAALAGEIAWFDPGPLAGKRVVVTRAREQASDLAERLAALGALVIEAPVIKTIPRDSDQTFLDAATGDWDWVMYTSASAVRGHFAALSRLQRDTRSLAASRIGAIGEATAAELSRHGLLVDFIPTRATAEQLAMESPIEPGDRVFYPASALSDDAFAAKLRERGASVEQVAAYDTITQPLDAQTLREVAEAHAITFTSASTALNLRAALPEGTSLDAVKLVSIGPRTSDAVREAFGRVDREASTPSLDALVEAIREVLQ